MEELHLSDFIDLFLKWEIRIEGEVLSYRRKRVEDFEERKTYEINISADHSLSLSLACRFSLKKKTQREHNARFTYEASDVRKIQSVS